MPVMIGGCGAYSIRRETRARHMGSASRASWAVFRRARAVSDCWRRKGGDESYRVGALLAGQPPSTAAPIRVCPSYLPPPPVGDPPPALGAPTLPEDF